MKKPMFQSDIVIDGGKLPMVVEDPESTEEPVEDAPELLAEIDLLEQDIMERMMKLRKRISGQIDDEDEDGETPETEDGE